MSDLVKRSVSLSGHRTSIALEPEFWNVLLGMAGTGSLAAVIADIDARRTPERPLASALRVAALNFMRAQSAEDRHSVASPILPTRISRE
ncbi:ribbon-helix-helix domain-containing protein [Brytella acorum]|uniref:Ribbon-helix-helix domain-containing protein n=1 Tax=Brytella acorum TaxID=2959299 RepID=A0AA35UM89_9PROT|nr:ribbon-helix-helix domain-containing protein [Brytella acorum]MDF3623571.1 ribbon-helix-helix domain-containing protein [Brytella acorum]CAI9120011.1 ribbon-helix-helix domain-containing protein [Brytella acorum]